MPRKPALGRGLKALMPDTPRARSGLAELPLDSLQPNPEQPRHRFDPAALQELAQSLREHGILQPILVHEDPAGGYIIIAGERRWRAARLAGLATVPAFIRERLAEGDGLELALVENLQRRDLTPLEEARAYEQLKLRRGLSQAEIASRVGVDRSTVANSLRLLKLPPDIQELVEGGSLSAGHARALLAFPDEGKRRHWARLAAETGLSVRDLEQAARGGRQADPKTTPQRKKPQPDPNLVHAAHQLSLHLGTRVDIRPTRRGASIVIRCSDHKELMRVYDRLLEDA
jgi:ParB family chromosome partitioning protein